MSLSDKINTGLKESMKSKDKGRLQALRAIKSALLLAKTDGSGEELTEADEIKLLQKLVKQRRDSAEIYKSQKRDDLYVQEVMEADTIAEFLPEQMGEKELKAAIEKIISDTGASSMKDMGKVMGIASKQFAGKADGKSISIMVKSLLASSQV